MKDGHTIVACYPFVNSTVDERIPNVILKTTLSSGENLKTVNARRNALCNARVDLSTSIDMVKFEINELAIDLIQLIAVYQRLKNDPSLELDIELNDGDINKVLSKYIKHSGSIESTITFERVCRNSLLADICRSIDRTQVKIDNCRKTLRSYINIEKLTASIANEEFFNDIENTTAAEPSKVKGLLVKAMKLCENPRVKPFSVEDRSIIREGDEVAEGMGLIDLGEED